MTVGLERAIDGVHGMSTSGVLARRLRASLLVAAGFLCACLLWSASASALVQRGHVFGSTFEGTAEHAFNKATGVAVNESTGEVFVVDPAHERVEAFKPDGKGGYEFSLEFGVPGAEAIAIDNSASSPSHGDVYVSGVEKKPAKGEVLEPGERNFVYKFTADGTTKLYKKQVFKIKEKIVNELGETVSEEFEVELESISGLAVDASGKLWAYWGEEGFVAGFTNDEKPNKLIGTSIKESVARERFECRALLGFGVAPHDEAFYLRHERGTGGEACPEEAALPNEVANALIGKTDGSGAAITTGLTGQNSSGVAVDETTGDVYVDNVTSIAAFTSDGTAIQRFGSGALAGGGALAVDHATERVFAVEGTGSKIAVFIPEEVAQAPTVDSLFAQVLSPTSTALIARIDARGAVTTYTFQYGTAGCVSEPSTCSTISGELPASFGAQVAEAKLEGLAPDTTYFYRVIAHNAHGTAESSQFASTFFTTLPSSEGLLPNHREWEMVSPPTKGGPLQAMSLEGAAIQASENGDALTYGAENSGPAGTAQGNRSIAVTQFFSTRGSEEWATQDITTPHNKGEGVIPGRGETEEYRIFSQDLSLGLVEPELHSEIASPCEEPPLSAPFPGEQCEGAPGREKTMYLRADAPVQPGAAEKPAYEEAAKSSGYLDPGYLPLVTAANNTGEVEGAKSKYGQGLEFADASADLNHVVFESGVPLVKGAVGEGLYQWDFGASGLRLVSALPVSGEGANEPKLGSYGNSRHAISANGTRTIFSSEFHGKELNSNVAAFLFLRDATTKPAKTVQINAVPPGENVSEPSEAQRENEAIAETRFQTASTDGSKVLFTDTWPLTEESNLHPTEASHPADLYEYDAASGKLVDLTASKDVAGADVLGTIPGASEDGSLIYFVANGILAPGASQGHCPETVVTPSEVPHGATCNLYISRPNAATGKRETRFIAALSADDSAVWGLPNNQRLKEHEADLTYVTSRVSPGSGEYLAFMSNRSLTNYDNTDAVSKAADEEVFLYNAKAGSIVCASCNPSGAAPKGVFDKEASGEGLGLLVDRPEVWKNRWLAGSIPGWTAMGPQRSTYQSRYLTATGRLFFNSADALVPQDQNTKQDVYQFEPQGVGGCERASGCVALISSGAATDTRETAFLDASVSGNDVFFLTSQKLLAQDLDGAFDVYDARVCGTAESGACLPHKPPPPPPCSGEGCKPPVSGATSFPGSATANFSGPGNTPSTGVLPSKAKSPVKTTTPTRAQKLSKALKSCRKQFKHKKKKLAACEKKARKKYGAKKAKAKKSGAIRRSR
jgi:hypothetical protein